MMSRMPGDTKGAKVTCQPKAVSNLLTKTLASETLKGEIQEWLAGE